MNKEKHEYREKRYDLANGVCICEICHNDFHNKYGFGYNTLFQYEEFKYMEKIYG